MSLTWRLSRWLLTVAARRWPADISADLLREWQAELAVLRHSPVKMLGYAGSLAVAPTVDGPSWAQRTTTAATAAGATLLAAALSNAVHATTSWLLIPAAATMAWSARRARMTPVTAVSVMAPTLFTFLFLGNPVSVMPFMGLRDVAPAAATWFLTMLLTLTSPRPLRPLAAAASLLTATAAGSLHAAHALNVNPWSAPLWFPLSLLPPGPAPHLPPLFLGNATATTTPLLLCTVFVLFLTPLRPAAAHPTGLIIEPATTASRRSRAHAIAGAPGSPRRQATLGAAAAIVAIATCEITLMATADPTAVAHRILHHSAVFGFGFTTHPAGQAAVALLAAALTLRLTEPIPE